MRSFLEHRLGKQRIRRISTWLDDIFFYGGLFVVWLIGGILFAVSEDWTLIDGLYFAFQCITTCGYGDLQPQGAFGKYVMIVYSFFAVVAMGYVQLPSARAQRRMLIKEIRDVRRGTKMMPRRVTAGVVASCCGDMPAERNQFMGLVLKLVGITLGGALFFGLTNGWSPLESLLFVEVTVGSIGHGGPYVMTQWGRLVNVMYGFLAFIVFHSTLSAAQSHFVTTFEAQIHFQESVQGALADDAELDSAAVMIFPRKRLKLATLTIFATYILGIGVYCAAEGWSLVYGAYFCAVTIATVGLGDPGPATMFGRVFTLFYVPLAVLSLGHMLAVITAIAAIRVTSRRVHVVEKLARGPLKDWLVESDDEGGDNDIEEDEGGFGEPSPHTPRSAPAAVEEIDEVEAPQGRTVMATTLLASMLTGHHNQPHSTHEAPRNRQKDLKILVGVILGFFLFMAALFHVAERHTSVLDSLTLSAVTLNTVSIGMGDMIPRTTVAQFFSVIYAVFSVVAYAYGTALVTEIMANRARQQLVEEHKALAMGSDRPSAGGSARAAGHGAVPGGSRASGGGRASQGGQMQQSLIGSMLAPAPDAMELQPLSKS